MHPLFRRFHALIATPRLPWVVAAVAVVLTLPALAAGFVIDDWFHQAMLRGIETPIGLPEPFLGMFDFLGGGPKRAHLLRNFGFGPWWLPDDLHARFLRPVTVVTHLFDQLVGPGSAVVAHAHSIVWSAAVVGVVALLYRRLMPAVSVAGLAAVLYLLDESRGLVTGWVANRSALVALVFGVCALLAHDAWRRRGWRWGQLLGPILLLAALLSAESGLATTAYLFGYAIFVDDGSLRQRLVRLLPYFVVVVVWRIVYSHLGYGASGSGLYIDPVTQPDRFLVAAARRFPILQLGQWTSAPTILFGFFPLWLKGVCVAVALVLLAGIGALLRPVLRESKTARMWATGMLLATVPICATFTSNRLLGFVSIGGSALLAELVSYYGVLGFSHTTNRSRLARWSVLLLAVPPLVTGPVALPASARLISYIDDLLFAPCQQVVPETPDINDRTAIFVNSNSLCVGYMAIQRVVEGRNRPQYVRLLASAIYEVAVTGVDDRTLRLTVDEGFHSHTADQLMRSGDDPLPKGHKVAIDGLTIEVLSHTKRGHVRTVQMTFDRPLRDPSLLWVATKDRTLGDFVPPRPGETIVLPAAF